MTVTVTHLQVTIDALEDLANLKAWIKKPLQRANELLMEEVRDYPDKDPTAFTRLAKPQNRRAYWAKVNSGEIQHGANGYIRSNKLRDSWEELKIRISKSKASAGVESNLPGNQFVMGKRQPDFIKASGWQTDEQIAKTNEREVTFFVEDGIDNFVRRRLA